MSEERTNCLEPSGSPRSRAINRILQRAKMDKLADTTEQLDCAKVRRFRLQKELKSLESEISKLQDFILEQRFQDHTRNEGSEE